ncbi:hypothetical protein M408DRAFT_11122 [Serendipita vermifera MAFF 305830]|uniref:Something about silencing protein 4 domain-containing protein n=1 Tax=Serendipita vermifera MAFF 305830 TaxID=933852 RepID=A0A0C3AW95_SERVB|nr:hypothetical protein M408DRAFT_11122 [Serendipita vermifera MAFF 305830]
MELAQDPGTAYPPNPLTFVMENYPTPQPQPQPEPSVPAAATTQPMQVDWPQADANDVDTQQQPSEFSQEQYTEGMTRRVQPPRARRTDFGKHSADDLIIDAIERAEREKPIIPPETTFFCTTDNDMMPNMKEVLDSIHPAGTGPVDELPMHSYFRNAEVMRKIRNQELIETPTWREATQQDWDEALAAIPEQWRNIPPDTSLEYYRRHHTRLERLEASVRNREKAKLAHDYHHLKARIAELQQLDTTGFRGDTLEEQANDRTLVLNAAKKLLENRRMKGKVEDGEMEDEEGDGVELREEYGASQAKSATKASRPKKESKWEYYPPDYDLDEEIVVDSSKRKRPKKKPPVKGDKPATVPSKKRKRETAEMEYTYMEEVIPEPEPDDEYVEGPQVATTFKKPKVAAPKRSLGPTMGIFKEKERDERLSKLLDLSRKYNPKRPPRELHPFGAPIPELELWDFDLPQWVRWEESAELGEVQANGEENMAESTGEMEAASEAGVVHGPAEQPQPEDPTTEPDEPMREEQQEDRRVPSPKFKAPSPKFTALLATEEAESSGLSDPD